MRVENATESTMFYNGLSVFSHPRFDHASPCTGAGSGEGKLRSSSMSRTASTPMPLLLLDRAGTADAEVATVTEAGADADTVRWLGARCLPWPCRGPLERAHQSGDLFGARELRRIDLCVLREALSSTHIA